MNSYQIIDEPKARASDTFIVNPTIILFVAIFLPFFWNPPFMGRLWMPFIWLIANGFLLGSSTLKSEVLIAVVGIIAMFGLFFGFVYLGSIEPFSSYESLYQYLRIFLNGTFFFILYLIVFRQSVAYEIYSYIRDNK